MARVRPDAYSSTIDNGMSEMAMNLQLGLRTLALLALVAASTAMLVKPELIGAPAASTASAFAATLAIGHN
jgi:hypothetical protein